MPGALAFRYARSLADVVLAPGSEADPQKVAAEIMTFEKTLEDSRDLKIILESPTIPPARKRAVVAELAKVLPLSSLVRRFLCVLVDHRRAAQLTEVREAFEAVIDERLDIARAAVASARTLSEPERDEVVAALTQLTGKQVRAQFRVQDDLIGGVVARIGSTVYDGSIRGQLQGLKTRLAGTGL